MTTQKALYVKIAKACLVAAVVAGVAIPTWAGQPADASGISLKVTGVAVVDDTKEGRKEGRSGAKFLPPETRIVVPSAKQHALFRVEYDVPTNMNACIWLTPNCTHGGTGGRFDYSPSALHSGTGTVRRILHLGDDCHDRHVHLKSVRLSVTLEDVKGKKSSDLFIGDAPVNVVYASGELKDGATKYAEHLMGFRKK